MQSLNTVEELIEDIRQGKMVILMDDEGRENEGDIIMASSKVRSEDIAFMVRHACGLVCMPMTRERCEQLRLPLMVSDNLTPHGTNFTLSIEATVGTTTGISAADRATTIQAAVAPNAVPDDIIQPGHIFPLMAQPGGVLSRAGHTEAGCDLAKLAGLEPSAVIVEIMNEDGTMARRPELEVFADKHGLKMGTIADLIQYRMTNEKTVDRTGSYPISTEYGDLTVHSYQDVISNELHLAIVKGSISPDEPVVVRVQQADTMRDLLHTVRSNAPKSWSMHSALEFIGKQESGVLVLIAHQETPSELLAHIEWLSSGTPRKNGLGQESHIVRTVGGGSQVLRDLGVQKMRLLSSEVKYNALSGFGLEVVDYIPCE